MSLIKRKFGQFHKGSYMNNHSPTAQLCLISLSILWPDTPVNRILAAIPPRTFLGKVEILVHYVTINEVLFSAHHPEVPRRLP